MSSHDIPKYLINSYFSARFRVFIEHGEVVLIPGEKSEKLLKLHPEFNLLTSAVITAYNPYSEETKDSINEAENINLKETISKHWNFVLAEGFDPNGQWKPEPSVLILGIELNDAISIGKQYKQNAIVYISDSAQVDLYNCFNGQLLEKH